MYEPFHVNVRVKISALWTAMLFVFAYYILGSVIEVALLAAVVYYAATWPRGTPPARR